MLMPSDVGERVTGWFSDGWDWLRDGVTGIFDDDGGTNPIAPATGAPAAGQPSRVTGILLVAAGVAAGLYLARK